MADTTYNVRVKYHLDKDKAEADARSLAKSFDRVAEAVTAAFAVHKVLDFSRRIVELQAYFENMQIALSTMMVGFGAPGFQSGAASFKDAMVASSYLMDKIRQDAATLPGTAEEMMEIMRAAMPGGIRSGRAIMGPDSIMDMSKKLMAAGNLLQIPGGATTVAREFQAIMEGRAQSRNDLFARIRGLMNDGKGIGAKELNALTEPQRWDMINKALDKLVGPALADYAHTWKAISTATQTWAQQIARVATGGMFDTLKTHLKEANDWFVRNRTEVEATLKAFGEVAGERLGAAFDAMRDALGFMVQHRGEIMAVVQAMGALLIGGKLATGFGKGAGSMAGGAGLGLALNALTGGSDNPYATAGMGIAGALISFGGALGVAAAAALAFGSAANMVSEALDDWHKGKMLQHERGAMLMNLYKTFDATHALGDVGLRQAQEIIQQYHLSEPGAKNGGSISMQRFAAYFGGLTDLDTSSRESRDSALRMLEYANKMYRDSKEFGPSLPSAEDLIKQKLYQAGRAVPEKPQVNVNVVIKQDISEAGDPDRILVKTKQAIEDALIRPIESGSQRFAVRR